jgi:hypothetical protein
MNQPFHDSLWMWHAMKQMATTAALCLTVDQLGALFLLHLVLLCLVQQNPLACTRVMRNKGNFAG